MTSSRSLPSRSLRLLRRRPLRGTASQGLGATPIRLGVNIDHCATLRQVRGGATPYPDILRMAQLAVKGGADQITIHLREDRRHIQEKDLAELTQFRPALINLEMAATRQMQKMALLYKPDWVCFVPEKRAELTTEGGLNVMKQAKVLGRMVERLQRIGIEVSMFIEPDLRQVRWSAALGAEAIELHTGAWASACQRGKNASAEWGRLVKAATYAHELGLNVHAGHGLDYETTRKILDLPHLEEVNIGHSLVCYALEEGLTPAVRKMAQIVGGQRRRRKTVAHGH